MPPVIVPPSENGAEAYLLALFRQTELKLIREIARKRGQGYVDYAEVAALARVRKTIERMKGDAEKYVPLMIEHEFYQGAEAAAGYANAQALINPARSRAVEIRFSISSLATLRFSTSLFRNCSFNNSQFAFNSSSSIILTVYRFDIFFSLSFIRLKRTPTLFLEIPSICAISS